jgi:hypothetical protein
MRGSIVESATYGEDGKFDCIIIEDNDEKRMSERKRSVYRGEKIALGVRPAVGKIRPPCRTMGCRLVLFRVEG